MKDERPEWLKGNCPRCGQPPKPVEGRDVTEGDQKRLRQIRRQAKIWAEISEEGDEGTEPIPQMLAVINELLDHIPHRANSQADLQTKLDAAKNILEKLVKWDDDCVEARTWGGPTRYRELNYFLDIKEVREALALINE